MSYRGKENPADLSCFKMCRSCTRCANKGTLSDCGSCSGRIDPKVRKEPNDFADRCRCSEGILQYRLKNGELIIAKFNRNPYEGKVQQTNKSQDERDWDAYVDQKREELDDPNFDPISFNDGASATDWMRR